jgi:hypothetical protein
MIKKMLPRLCPVAVPWMISASVPHLRLNDEGDGMPCSATFIANFLCPEVNGGASEDDEPLRVLSPGAFQPAHEGQMAPYHLVRVTFLGSKVARKSSAYSDIEVVEEASFDWSNVPTTLLPGESIEANIARSTREWAASGLSPDPGMYEVQNSPWLDELGIRDKALRHFLLLGHDEYIDVAATGWTWEKGQPA